MNFDPVAHVYDATRGLPAPVSEFVADRIVAATNAGPDTNFLEVGVGTGRIALPLVRRGYRFTGIDISDGMLQQFRAKAGDPSNLTLLQSDVTKLPLPDRSQDVALAVHVFHLIPEWPKALEEVRRVLRPDGSFVWGGNHSPGDHPGRVIRRQWATFVEELGGAMRPRHAEWEDIQAETTAQGAYTAVYRAARWRVEFRPIDLMTNLHDRVFSAGWTVQQEILDEAHERLQVWGREQLGDLERPVEGYEEFLVHVTQWPH